MDVIVLPAVVPALTLQNTLGRMRSAHRSAVIVDLGSELKLVPSLRVRWGLNQKLETVGQAALADKAWNRAGECPTVFPFRKKALFDENYRMEPTLLDLAAGARVRTQIIDHFLGKPHQEIMVPVAMQQAFQALTDKMSALHFGLLGYERGQPWF